MREYRTEDRRAAESFSSEGGHINDYIPKKVSYRWLKWPMGIVIAAFFIGVAYFSLVDKEINKGIWGLLDWTDDDTRLVALDNRLNRLHFDFLSSKRTEGIDLRASVYMKEYYGLAAEQVFPDDLPEYKGERVENRAYSRVNLKKAAEILGRKTGASHEIREAYLCDEIANGMKRFTLFYREDDAEDNNPDADWKMLPLTGELKDELTATRKAD